ncbi:hypothetical protein QBC47DRAFT_165152 [Echria macrotheca]|uniref:Heterokaryon incompatibility domain-containing protein n=1 Tax=Echria macrotheca TaxID=438768 RepID=A0AAJ0F7B8_9PEZI|nr:hypothetical protein QBC47DRAFT_165152 [Echria macrotheca]
MLPDAQHDGLTATYPSAGPGPPQVIHDPLSDAPAGPSISSTARHQLCLSNEDGLIDKYKYLALQPGHIRLLHLLPHPETDAPVRCEISDYPLHGTDRKAAPYEALSYCWGSSDKPYCISIGERRLPVTENLFAALLQLRDPFAPRLMWIDAICINQEDITEREHQVRLMAEIYCKASRVVVWLGEVGDTDDHHTLQAVCIAGIEPAISSGSSPSRETVVALLNRPWFRRIWVLQEVAAARHIRIMCGSTEVDGYAFCLGIEACLGQRNLIHQMVYLMKQSIFRPRYRIVAPGRVSLGIRPLAELVGMYHNHEATERHDKIFALLGMSTDDPDDIEDAGLSPSYSISWEKLLAQLIQFLMGKQATVYTRSGIEAAVIKGVGHVLGRISHLKDQHLHIKRGSFLLPEKWLPQPSVSEVKKDDIICLLQGAKTPCIIRPHHDHFVVIIASVTLSMNALLANDGRAQEDMLPPNTNDFLLVWGWNSFWDKCTTEQKYEPLTDLGAVDSQPEIGTKLSEAIRLRDAALILQQAGLRFDADVRFEEMGRVLGNDLCILYDHMMTDIEQRRTLDLKHCNRILSVVFLAYGPLYLLELPVVADLPPDTDIKSAVGECCFLRVTEQDAVEFIHQSVKDYIGRRLLIQPGGHGVAQTHWDIGRRSLDAMSLLLRQNMYDLDFGAGLNNDLDFVGKAGRNQELLHSGPLASIGYSCEFWVDHLCFQGGASSDDSDGRVYAFLAEHFLHWLEALALIEEKSKASELIKRLHSASRERSHALVPFLNDAQDFIDLDWNRWLEPMQTYGSPLVWVSNSNMVKKMFWKQRLPFIRPTAGLGCGLDDHEMETSDGNTAVNRLLFSPNGKMVATSTLRMIRFWDVSTGTYQRAVGSNGSDLYTMAFSPNADMFASGEVNGSIRLLHLKLKTGPLDLEAPSHINDLAFSPDAKVLASASGDSCVWLWDTAAGSRRLTLAGHSKPVDAVTFSQNGKIVASASTDRTIRLWDTENGASLAKWWMERPEFRQNIQALAFSPDDKTLASALAYNIVFWDIATGTPQRLLKPSRDDHSPIRTLSFPSKDSNVIRTDIGRVFLTPASDSSDSEENQTRYIVYKTTIGWIIRNGKKVLQLPWEYRTIASAVYDDTVVLGHRSGEVTFLPFSFSE